MKATKAFFATALVAVAHVASSMVVGAQDTDAQRLYETHCGVCHQLDGGGVPMLQPELIGRPRANGPKGAVIDVILNGSKALAPTESDYGNEMPSFAHLSDLEIALIATYVRTHFENNGGPVTADDVKSRR